MNNEQVCPDHTGFDKHLDCYACIIDIYNWCAEIIVAVEAEMEREERHAEEIEEAIKNKNYV